MEPGINYWIVAWAFRTVAFLTAFLAVLLGARGLDQIADQSTNQDD